MLEEQGKLNVFIIICFQLSLFTLRGKDNMPCCLQIRNLGVTSTRNTWCALLCSTLLGDGNNLFNVESEMQFAIVDWDT